MTIKTLIYSVGLFVLGLTTIWAIEYPKDEVAYELFAGQTFPNPLRIHSVIISENGFYPESIMLFKGEKLKLFVTNTQNDPSCLMIPEKKLFLSAEKGMISEGEVSFDKTGVYEFFCPSKRNIKGRIVVIEKKSELEKIKRDIASKNTVNKQWFPKDDPGADK